MEDFGALSLKLWNLIPPYMIETEYHIIDSNTAFYSYKLVLILYKTAIEIENLLGAYIKRVKSIP